MIQVAFDPPVGHHEAVELNESNGDTGAQVHNRILEKLDCDLDGAYWVHPASPRFLRAPVRFRAKVSSEL